MVDVQRARSSGVLDQRAYQLLGTLIAGGPEYAATARRVFLRMVVDCGEAWQCRPVPRNELVYADHVENVRVGTLLTTFRDARLLHDDDGWQPAPAWQLRAWPMLATWCARFGAAGLALQRDLVAATARWYPAKRPSFLWHDDPRMPAAIRAMRAADSWLNARERGFVAASLRRRLRLSARRSPALLASSADDRECSCCRPVPGDDPA